MTESMRLDKRVAAQFACSRAEARQFIENGWITVDGAVTDTPQTMVDAQIVARSDDARLDAIEPATMLLHKPAGVAWSDVAPLVAPDTRDAADPAEERVLKRHFQRLAPGMPMDTEASGLIVVSQDGRLHRRLAEDYALIEQEFVVEVSGRIQIYGLARLAEGLSYQGRRLPRCKVSWQNEIRLRFAIKDVQPGQLEAMCGEVGLGVVAIRRLRIGRIPLGKLAPGAWRYLPAGQRF